MNVTIPRYRWRHLQEENVANKGNRVEENRGRKLGILKEHGLVKKVSEEEG